MRYDVIEFVDYDGKKKIVSMPREARQRETKESNK